ncbi:MAG: hypothetical protein AB7E68_00870 [Candidatus Babeliales bacterium]
MSAFALWTVLGQLYELSITQEIPVIYHKANDQTQITGPEKITVRISGKRSAFALLTHELAVHKDTTHLSAGNHSVIFSGHDLLLPSSLSMIDCNPRIASITIQ